LLRTAACRARSCHHCTDRAGACDARMRLLGERVNIECVRACIATHLNSGTGCGTVRLGHRPRGIRVEIIDAVAQPRLAREVRVRRHEPRRAGSCCAQVLGDDARSGTVRSGASSRRGCCRGHIVLKAALEALRRACRSRTRRRARSGKTRRADGHRARSRLRECSGRVARLLAPTEARRQCDRACAEPLERRGDDVNASVSEPREAHVAASPMRRSAASGALAAKRRSVEGAAWRRSRLLRPARPLTVRGRRPARATGYPPVTFRPQPSDWRARSRSPARPACPS
jgi:hypothetical protein